MIYLTSASGPQVTASIAAGELGQMITPNSGNRLVDGATWALDNGRVKLDEDRQPIVDPDWTPDRWLARLERYQHAPRCLFAVVPDYVGDAVKTDQLWGAWWSAPMRFGYPAAYVAQDGCQRIPLGAKALFIGGTTEWKLGDHAKAVVEEAHRRHLWVHMGRVNTLGRLQHAHALGCHSVDGTLLAFGAKKNLPILRGFLRRTLAPTLF